MRPCLWGGGTNGKTGSEQANRQMALKEIKLSGRVRVLKGLGVLL